MHRDPASDAEDAEQDCSEEKIEAESKRPEKELLKKKRLLDKKFAQGVATLEKMEKKKAADIVSNEPTANVLFIYFGVDTSQ